jgi:hypothetical protein
MKKNVTLLKAAVNHITIFFCSTFRSRGQSFLVVIHSEGKTASQSQPLASPRYTTHLCFRVEWHFDPKSTFYRYDNFSRILYGKHSPFSLVYLSFLASPKSIWLNYK